MRVTLMVEVEVEVALAVAGRENVSAMSRVLWLHGVLKHSVEAINCVDSISESSVRARREKIELFSTQMALR